MPAPTFDLQSHSTASDGALTLVSASEVLYQLSYVG